MINFKKNFLINFFKEEIRSGTKNGITVMDKAIAFSPSKVAPTHPNVKLFDAYIELYSQIEKGSFNWYLDDDQDTKDAIMGINYVQTELIGNQGYEEDGILRYVIAGGLNIPNFKEAFSQNSMQGYYLAVENMGLDPNSFIPIDYHCPSAYVSYTACLRIENGELIDNVWLVSYQGEELFDMEIGIETYFQLAYACKAVYEWQFDYMWRAKGLKSVLHEVLPLVFPVDTLDLAPFAG